jgi:hypothetical protein
VGDALGKGEPVPPRGTVPDAVEDTEGEPLARGESEPE